MSYVWELAGEFSAEPNQRTFRTLIGEASGTTHCAALLVETAPGGGSAEGTHTHEFDQLFVILSGAMTVEIAGEQQVAGPQSLVWFPAGVPHRNWNAGAEPTIHLSVLAPAPVPGAPLARKVPA